MEIWKTITERGITLEISSEGRVRVPSRTHSYTRVRDGKTQTITRQRKATEIAPQQHHTGYQEIGFRIDRERARFLVHRLVAIAFVDGYEPGLCVNHINGIKTDNRADNLEWVSVARNTKHAWETGLVDLHGENQPTHKLTSKQVVYIRKLLRQGISPHTLAIVAGVSEALIYLIRDGKRWKKTA